MVLLAEDTNLNEIKLNKIKEIKKLFRKQQDGASTIGYNNIHPTTIGGYYRFLEKNLEGDPTMVYLDKADKWIFRDQNEECFVI